MNSDTVDGEALPMRDDVKQWALQELASHGIPERARDAIIRAAWLQNPGDLSWTIFKLREVMIALAPKFLTPDEMATLAIRKMSDRQILEAIYRAVVRI